MPQWDLSPIDPWAFDPTGSDEPRLQMPCATPRRRGPTTAQGTTARGGPRIVRQVAATSLAALKSTHKDRSKTLLTRCNVLIDWQRELEDRAPGRIGARPQSSAMPLDDRATDRQPESQAVRLGRVEGVEEMLESGGRQSRA